MIARLSGGTQFVTGDLSDPEINISYGSYYLRYLLRPLRRQRGRRARRLQRRHGNVDGWGGSDLDLDGIGFPETRAYVEEVLDKRQEYRDKYAADLGLAR